MERLIIIQERDNESLQRDFNMISEIFKITRTVEMIDDGTITILIYHEGSECQKLVEVL